MKLDHDLGRACGVFKTKSDEGMTEVVTMPRTHVLQGLKDAMQPCVRIGGESGTIKKGMLQPIKIAVKTRQGKKMVTLITGMETFGVDPDEMAEELKKICAGSATGEWKNIVAERRPEILMLYCGQLIHSLVRCKNRAYTK